MKRTVAPMSICAAMAVIFTTGCASAKADLQALGERPTMACSELARGASLGDGLRVTGARTARSSDLSQWIQDQGVRPTSLEGIPVVLPSGESYVTICLIDGRIGVQAEEAPAIGVALDGSTGPGKPIVLSLGSLAEVQSKLGLLRSAVPVAQDPAETCAVLADDRAIGEDLVVEKAVHTSATLVNRWLALRAAAGGPSINLSNYRGLDAMKDDNVVTVCLFSGPPRPVPGPPQESEEAADGLTVLVDDLGHYQVDGIGPLGTLQKQVAELS